MADRRPDPPDESTADTLLSSTPGAFADEASGSIPIDETPVLLAGRYEVLGLLGAGGMGRVYKVRDRELGELVALKVLQGHAPGDAAALERFRREARLARHVTHRNVVRLFDIGEAAGTWFLTMELVDGESLAALLQRSGPLGIARVIDLALAVCSGLAAAHEAGVVHRDLKPGNVILARDGRVVLTDFGVATSAADADTSQLTGGLVVGTPDYMAPEQVEAKGEVDARADVFALGVMLFEMLAGQLPWTGRTSMAVAIARLLVPAPDPTTLRADVPPALAATVLRCLARQPADRFASVREVAAALGAVVRPLSPDAAAPRNARGAATGSIRFGSPLPGLKTVAVLPFRNVGPPEDAYVVDGLTEDLADTLSTTPGLRVRAGGVVRAAAAAGDEDPRAIGRALGVQVVVEGSVRRIAEGLRISARLVGVGDGFQLWAARFDRPTAELLVVSDEVARAITEALTTEVVAPSHRSTQDAEAVDLYLRARHESRNRFSGVAARRTVELFAQAVARAPADPAFLSGYAMALVRMGWHVSEDEGRRALAVQMAERAVALAPHIAEPHLALGTLYLSESALPDAVRAFEAATHRNPTLAEAHESLGGLLVESGSVEEGLRHLEAAYELDPGNEIACAWISRVHYLLGDRDGALEWLSRVQGRSMWPMVALFHGRMTMGDRDAAAARRLLEELPRDPNADPGFTARGLLEYVATGRLPDASRAFLDRLTLPTSERRKRSLGHQLRAELAAFERDEATVLAEVERAVEAGLFDVLWMDHSPSLDGVRGTAAFAALRLRVAAAAGTGGGGRPT